MKQIIILLTFLYGLVFSAFGQGSSQATMKVSVKVISGKSVKTVQPDRVNIDKSRTDLGQIRLNETTKGNSVVSLSEEVTLTNKKGNSVDMDLKDLQEDKHHSKISLEGSISSENIPAGIYQGNLVATIEYF